MKTCPVCKTSLFDDMEVCYGCMYTFGSKPELEQRVSEQRVQMRPTPDQLVQQNREPSMASPLAGWSVRLEMRDTADPTRSWSMELAPSQTAPAVMTSNAASVATL